MNYLNVTVAVSPREPEEEFHLAVARAMNVYGESILTLTGHGRSPERAMAFALRDIADKLLELHPAFPEGPQA